MTSPFVRLGAFYFFYFAVIGGFQPYWGLYLQGQGFSPAAIGELMAIVMATRIIAPNFWGYIADHTGKRLQLVRFGAFMMLLVWLGVFGYASTGLWLWFYWHMAFSRTRFWRSLKPSPWRI